jgi:hypothetical protein
MIKWSHETFPNIHPHQTKIRRIFTPLFHASSTAKLCSSDATNFCLPPPLPDYATPLSTPPYLSYHPLQPLPILSTPTTFLNPFSVLTPQTAPSCAIPSFKVKLYASSEPLSCVQKKSLKNIQQRGFASGHPPDY